MALFRYGPFRKKYLAPLNNQDFAVGPINKYYLR